MNLLTALRAFRGEVSQRRHRETIDVRAKPRASNLSRSFVGSLRPKGPLVHRDRSGVTSRPAPAPCVTLSQTARQAAGSACGRWASRSATARARLSSRRRFLHRTRVSPAHRGHRFQMRLVRARKIETRPLRLRQGLCGGFGRRVFARRLRGRVVRCHLVLCAAFHARLTSGSAFGRFPRAIASFQ